jgi:hypothetical protein
MNGGANKKVGLASDGNLFRSNPNIRILFKEKLMRAGESAFMWCPLSYLHPQAVPLQPFRGECQHAL